MCPWDTDVTAQANRKQTYDRPEKEKHDSSHPDNA